MPRLLSFALALCLALGVLSAPVPTAAQTTPEAAPALPDPLTPDAARDMLARMSDDQVRGMLLERLDAVAATEAADETPASAGLFATIGTLWTAFYLPILGAFRALPHLFSSEARAIGNFLRAFESPQLLMMFVYTGIALAAGLAAEIIVNRLARAWRGQVALGAEPDLASTLRYLFGRFIRELLGLVAFYIVLRTVGLALLSPQQIVFAAPAVTLLIWLPRLAAALARFVLSPAQPELRLVNLDDHWARYLYHHLVGLVLLIGIGRFVVGFNIAYGVPITETRIAFWFSTAVHVYVGFIAWTARDGLYELILGRDPDRTAFDEAVARYYPHFALALTAGLWVLVQIMVGLGNTNRLLTAPHFTTMFWLLMVPALDTLIRGIVMHVLPPMIGEGRVAETAYRKTKRSYIRIGRVVLWAIVILLIAGAWDINLTDLNARRDGYADNLVQFLILLAIGYIVFELVSLSINRQLAREQTAAVTSDQSAGEGGGAGGSRLATVLPLLLLTAQVAIAVIFGLLAIGALGIDITPLLAGAGILGLAIGFGAQKLVTDVVSGIFFLVDDAFRVGEYVEVDGTMGTVEKISIRSMQLRHHRGLVHTIPYGEIPKLTNFSRDWVIMKLMFTVPFDTDPDKVKKIFKKIGAEMMEDPLYKDDFLEPFKSQGVLQFDDVGIVMRGKFMAKPGTQFTIRKEIYNRVRQEFAANGIEFARREVRVAIPGLEHEDHLDDAQKEAIAGAASAAVQTQIEKEQDAKGKK